MKINRLLILFAAWSFCSCLYASPTDSLQAELYGILQWKKGNTVQVQITGVPDMSPEPSQEGILSGRFETTLFGASVTGWLNIGKMRVEKCSSTGIQFLLLEELSIITENGVKKEHFIAGRELKFAWKYLPAEDEMLYNRGMELMKTDKHSAYLCFRRVAGINPKHHRALNMMGMIQDYREQYDSALIFFRSAYLLDSLNVTYIKNLTLSEFDNGNTVMSYQMACKAVLHAGSDPEAYYLRGRLKVFLAGSDAGPEDKRLALADLDRAVTLSDRAGYYLLERARIKLLYGDAGGACTDAAEAVKSNTDGAAGFITKNCQ